LGGYITPLGHTPITRRGPSSDRASAAPTMSMTPALVPPVSITPPIMMAVVTTPLFTRLRRPGTNRSCRPEAPPNTQKRARGRQKYRERAFATSNPSSRSKSPREAFCSAVGAGGSAFSLYGRLAGTGDPRRDPIVLRAVAAATAFGERFALAWTAAGWVPPASLLRGDMLIIAFVAMRRRRTRALPRSLAATPKASVRSAASAGSMPSSASSSGGTSASGSIPSSSMASASSMFNGECVALGEAGPSSLPRSRLDMIVFRRLSADIARMSAGDTPSSPRLRRDEMDRAELGRSDRTPPALVSCSDTRGFPSGDLPAAADRGLSAEAAATSADLISASGRLPRALLTRRLESARTIIAVCRLPVDRDVGGFPLGTCGAPAGRIIS